MQGIYTYIPQTSHVPREYTVAAILSLLFMVPISPVPALALLSVIIIIVIIIIISSSSSSSNSSSSSSSSSMDVSCHMPFLPGTSLEPAVNPTAQASSFTLLHTAVLSVLCVMFQV
jgi:hypothetical protein